MVLITIFKKYWKFPFLLLFLLFIVSCSPEKMEWEKVQSEHNLESLKEFIKKYPDGKYSEQAMKEIEAMSFKKARTKDTIESYQAFLNEFPSGAYASRTQSKLKNLIFSKAENESSIMIYKDFIRKFPEAYLAREAESRIKEFEQGIHPGWKDVKKVRLILKLSYPEGADLPFKKWTREILERGGIELIEGDNEDTEATLTINSSGEGLRDSYGNIGYLYTGAEVSGNISFSNHKGIILRKAFKGKIDTPIAVYGKKHPNTTPGSAPFKKALSKKNSFGQRLFEVLQKSFGTKILICGLAGWVDEIRESAMAALIEIKDPKKSTLLINCLKHKGRGVETSAAKILVEIKDPQVVESLIEAIKDDQCPFKTEAIEVLGKIGDSRAVKPILSYLKRTSLKSRGTIGLGSAIEALGEFGDPRAIEPLLNVWKVDENRWVGKDVWKALQKITGQKFLRNYEVWEEWWEKKKAK